MRIGRPSELVLAYTQQMMAWLLFVAPRRSDAVAILGLGAGALLRFTLRHTSSQTETVEWNPQVTAACRTWFRLPGSARSRIVHADADDWVQQTQNHDRFVALMVDLYDADAQGPVCDSLAFYQACRAVLVTGGVMTVNLFGNHHSFAPNMENLAQAFDGQLLMLPEVDAGNRVVLAFRDVVPQLVAGRWLSHAQAVEARYSLPAQRWAKALLKQLQGKAAVA